MARVSMTASSVPLDFPTASPFRSRRSPFTVMLASQIMMLVPVLMSSTGDACAGFAVNIAAEPARQSPIFSMKRMFSLQFPWSTPLQNGTARSGTWWK